MIDINKEQAYIVLPKIKLSSAYPFFKVIYIILIKC